jgi:hypothetical protein
MGVINDIGYINTEGFMTLCRVSYRTVLVPSVLVYPMSLMTPEIMS